MHFIWLVVVEAPLVDHLDFLLVWHLVLFLFLRVRRQHQQHRPSFLWFPKYLLQNSFHLYFLYDHLGFPFHALRMDALMTVKILPLLNLQLRWRHSPRRLVEVDVAQFHDARGWFLLVLHVERVLPFLLREQQGSRQVLPQQQVCLPVLKVGGDGSGTRLLGHKRAYDVNPFKNSLSL